MCERATMYDMIPYCTSDVRWQRKGGVMDGYTLTHDPARVGVCAIYVTMKFQQWMGYHTPQNPTPVDDGQEEKSG
jgi:hypothetical protein